MHTTIEFDVMQLIVLASGAETSANPTITVKLIEGQFLIQKLIILHAAEKLVLHNFN